MLNVLHTIIVLLGTYQLLDILAYLIEGRHIFE